jgi:DNA-binding transcriptional ArsR family regulator
MRSNLRAAAATKRSARVFAALGDETRLRLVDRLCTDAPLSIARLTDGFGVTRQAITKHLQVMQQAGLIRPTRRGRETVWQLDQARLENARVYLEQISQQWDSALARLKSWVET